MKNISLLYIFLFLLVIGCKNEEEEIVTGDIPAIQFALEDMDIDLNVASQLPVVAFIKSEVGLESVKISFITHDGKQIEYKTIDSFFNRKVVSISESPVYNATYSKILIEATDLIKQQSSATINLAITDIVQGPSVTFQEEEIFFDEATGGEMPVSRFSVKAPGGIKSIELWLNTSMGSTLLDGIEPTEDIFTYEFEQLIEYKPGNTGLRVVVYDKYEQVSIETLPVRYIEVPWPVIQVERDTVMADKDEEYLFKTQIEASLGVKNIALYRFEGNTKISIRETSYPEYPNNLNLEIPVVCTNATNKLLLEVTDKKGRTVEKEIICYVNLNIATNILLRSHYTVPTATNLPHVLPCLSLNDLKTYSVDYALTSEENASNIDIIFFCYSSQALNQIWNLYSNESKLAAKSESGKTLAGIKVKNATSFMLLPQNFDFDNATAASIAEGIDPAQVKSTNLSSGIVPGVCFAFKTASTSKAGGDRIGIIRVEDRFQIGNNQIDNYLVLSIKFPKN